MRAAAAAQCRAGQIETGGAAATHGRSTIRISASVTGCGCGFSGLAGSAQVGGALDRADGDRVRSTTACINSLSPSRQKIYLRDCFVSIILQIDHSAPLPRSLKERSSQMSTATSSSKRSGKLMLWQGPQRAVHTIRRPSSPWTTGDATCWVSTHLSSLLVTVAFGNSLKPSFHPRHVAALPAPRRSSMQDR